MHMCLKTCLSGMGEGEDVIRDVSFQTPAGSHRPGGGLREAGNPRCSGSWLGFGTIRWGISAWRKGTSGEIRTDSLLAQISMVMQNAYLFRGSIRENLCIGMRQSARNGWWRLAGGPAATSLSRLCQRATTPCRRRRRHLIRRGSANAFLWPGPF